MTARRIRNIPILCMYAALAIACATKASADERPHYPYRSLIHEGEYEKAEQALRGMAGKDLINGEDKWVLLVDLSRIYRLQGDQKKANNVLKQLSPEQAKQPYARLEAALLGIASADPQEKTTGQAEIVKLRYESDARVKQGANYQIAEHDFERELYDNCIRRCDTVIREIGSLKLYDYPDASDLRHLVRLARQLKERAQAKLLIQKFGEDYFHYRQGRLAQARGDYEKAVTEYGQVQADILKDAAACYTAQCAAELGYIPEAVKFYQRFIEENPYGLYRGEAMLQLARIQLLHATTKGQLKTAETQLAAALHWHQEIARQAPPVSVASIQQVLAQFPPPDQFTKRDNFGNYHRNQAGPETILNRLTSTWYLQELQVQTALLHAFVLNELGERKEALTGFEKTLELNDQYGGYILSLGDLPKRLLADAQDGAFLIPPGAWGGVSANHAVHLHLAFLYLTINDAEQAAPLFEQVLKATTNKPDHEFDRAAATLGLACVAFENGKLDAALAGLRRFDTEYAKTPLAPLASLMAANILTGQKSEESYREALQRYGNVAKGLSGTPYAERAWLSMAVAAYNRGDWGTADKSVRRAAAAKSESYREAAKTLAGLIDSAQTAESRRQHPPRSTHGGGRVVEVARHFVYPGPLDLRYDMSQLNPGDVMAYQIGFSIRGGCVLKNFHHSTSILEPQAPPTDETPLNFLRIPCLLNGL